MKEGKEYVFYYVTSLNASGRIPDTIHKVKRQATDILCNLYSRQWIQIYLNLYKKIQIYKRKAYLIEK